MKDTVKMSISSCQTDGLFFEKFTKGAINEWDIIKPDGALAVDILVEILHVMEVERGGTMTEKEQWELSLEGFVYVISFVCAL